MSFAFVSCSDYQEGYFPDYRAIAEDEDLDVVFLGDYIYEYGLDPNSTRVGQKPALADRALKRGALYGVADTYDPVHAVGDGCGNLAVQAL